MCSDWCVPWVSGALLSCCVAVLGEQNGAGAPAAVTEKADKEAGTEKGEKAEAREWIDNWKSKNA